MPTIEEIKTWPANFIQYYGAKAFADYYGYDLPTVDQWKLAAKGGADFEYATSDGTTNKGVAWINEDGPGFPPYPGHIQPAKSNEPNPLGIYNMGGNVWEWCEDWYRGTETFSMDKVYENYYISEEPENPEHLKALLGGSFNYFSATMSVDWVHAAKTGAGNDHFGFRVVKNNYILNELEENLETVEVEGLNLDDNCGHNIDPTIVNYGYNLVIDNNGNEVKPQGRPFQEGYQLIESETYIDDYNTREYAQIFAYIGNIRDALMCDIDALSENEWMVLTEVLELNNIKTTQSLTGTPKEQYYSSNGIYEHLTTNGEDFHPMMKYLEEAELELKCLAFKDFNFVNPKGENHCQIHNLDEGSGLILPE